MCGIAGFLTPDPERGRHGVDRMLAAMRHRGPDGEGQVERATPGGTLVLGHRRLALVDLTPTGAQPMIHAPTGNALVFNGEIYGFQDLRRRLVAAGESFRGTSDTEVLLVALTRWGEGVLRDVDGMYALAFHEVKSQRLLLARDPCGIKPLLTAEAAGELAFASEARGILASGVIPKALDPGALGELLAYGSTLEPRSIFRGVQMFPAGTAQWTQLSRRRAATTTTLWSYPAEQSSLKTEEAARHLSSLLAKALETHLVADVPMAIFLSSGMDSAVLAGLLARAQGNALALTVGFEGAQSEADGARETAARLGLRHEVLPLDEAFVRAAFPRWLAALDQPSADGFNSFLVTEAVHSRGFKVAISGLGADELWGGYGTHKMLARLKTWLAPVPAPVRTGLGSLTKILLMPHFGKVRAEKIRELIGAAGSTETLYFASRRLLSQGLLNSMGLRPAQPSTTTSPSSTLGRISFLEREHYLRNTLLRDADNMAMANGVEVRFPFLSRPLLDLATALPDDVRFPPDGRRKELLWRGFSDVVPAGEGRVAKRGFTLPFATWFDGPILRDWKQGALQALSQRAGIAAPALAGLVRILERPGVDHTGARRLILCVLGDFLDRHDLSA